MTRKRSEPTIGQTIGGVLVGFDEQVFGRRPPGQEVVEQIDRLRSVSPGSGLTIELPGDSTATETAVGGAGDATPADGR
jgi:hypothetical protein